MARRFQQGRRGRGGEQRALEDKPPSISSAVASPRQTAISTTKSCRVNIRRFQQGRASVRPTDVLPVASEGQDVSPVIEERLLSPTPTPPPAPPDTTAANCHTKQNNSKIPWDGPYNWSAKASSQEVGSTSVGTQSYVSSKIGRVRNSTPRRNRWPQSQCLCKHL